MRKMTIWLVITIISLLFSFPAYAGWKEKIVENQLKAVEYIQKLKSGADPDDIERPTLRRDSKAKANAANREIREAMEKAEEYARAGKYDSIEIPDFRFKLVSEETREDIARKRN